MDRVVTRLTLIAPLRSIHSVQIDHRTRVSPNLDRPDIYIPTWSMSDTDLRLRCKDGPT